MKNYGSAKLDKLDNQTEMVTIWFLWFYRNAWALWYLWCRWPTSMPTTSSWKQSSSSGTLTKMGMWIAVNSQMPWKSSKRSIHPLNNHLDVLRIAHMDCRCMKVIQMSILIQIIYSQWSTWMVLGYYMNWWVFDSNFFESQKPDHIWIVGDQLEWALWSFKAVEHWIIIAHKNQIAQSQHRLIIDHKRTVPTKTCEVKKALKCGCLLLVKHLFSIC